MEKAIESQKDFPHIGEILTYRKKIIETFGEENIQYEAKGYTVGDFVNVSHDSGIDEPVQFIVQDNSNGPCIWVYGFKFKIFPLVADKVQNR